MCLPNHCLHYSTFYSPLCWPTTFRPQDTSTNSSLTLPYFIKSPSLHVTSTILCISACLCSCFWSSPQIFDATFCVVCVCHTKLWLSLLTYLLFKTTIKTPGLKTNITSSSANVGRPRQRISVTTWLPLTLSHFGESVKSKSSSSH